MKLYFLPLVICIQLVLSAQLHAQKHKEDVVYLKNGSIYRGTYIPSADSGTYRIRIIGGSEFNLDRDEIDSVTSEKVAQLVKFRKPIYIKQKGYKFTFEYSWLFKRAMEVPDLRQATTLRFINGYQFNPYFHVGLGTGFDFQEGTNAAELFIPLYVQATADVLKKCITPYGFTNVGYRFGVLRDANWDLTGLKGGAMIGFGAGIKFNTRSKVAQTLSFGYNYFWSERKSEVTDWWTGETNTQTEKRRLSYWNLTWGFSF